MCRRVNVSKRQGFAELGIRTAIAARDFSAFDPDHNTLVEAEDIVKARTPTSVPPPLSISPHPLSWRTLSRLQHVAFATCHGCNPSRLSRLQPVSWVCQQVLARVAGPGVTYKKKIDGKTVTVPFDCEKAHAIAIVRDSSRPRSLCMGHRTLAAASPLASGL